jgi:carbamoyltransferase
MIILGMNFSHDGAVAVVKDGRLISAIGTERITRVKKDFGVTRESIQYVLDEAGVSIEDVDCIALADYLKKHDKDVLELLGPGENRIERTDYSIYHNDVRIVDGVFLGRKIPVYVLPHHLAHASSAYYTSNYEEAVCLSVDSSFGNLEDNSMIAVGRGNKLTAESCPRLISGIGYAIITELLGFTPAFAKAGTTMGLSCYGESLLKEELDRYLDEMFFTPQKDAELEYRIYWSDFWTKFSNKHPHELSFRESSDLAATIQELLQESILRVVRDIPNTYPDKNLCLSGGSFLNCMTNAAIKRTGLFDSIHHFPGCGDDGNAVGSALYVAHHVYDEPRSKYEPQDIAYLGRKQEYVEPDYDEVASMIADGKIVAWFMGSSEYGPRALGNRSILADPRSYHTRERINFAVKNREWFRPLAPAVLQEHVSEWFDLNGPSPFMLYTSQVLQPEKIPAVTHVDGSARHQTVTETLNPPFYRLIKKFYEKTGVPVIMNTSLNGNAQPILETEEQALEFFTINKNIDAIVINGILYKR